MKHLKTKAEFQTEVLDVKNTPVLVDFFAVWCGPCQMMEPILVEFEQKNKKVAVVKVNVDEAQELASQYNVMSIPTMFIFKDGEVVKQMVGVQTVESLEKDTASLI